MRDDSGKSAYDTTMTLAFPFRPEMTLAEILMYSAISFLIGLAATPSFLRFLRKYRLGKQLRATAVDGASASVFLEHHAHKAGTPTMGGLLICGSIIVTVAISRLLSLVGAVESSILQRGQVYIPLGMIAVYGLVGAADDLMNIRGAGKNRGLSALPKLALLLGATGIAAWWFVFRLEYQSVYLPFASFFGIADPHMLIGWWYIPLFFFVVIGTANAVNVTDGLDGLAGGLLLIAFGAFGVLAYLSGLSVLAAFCAVVAGAIGAFLWHNVPPAAYFMGDVGALALGGTLAVIAFMIDRVLVLPLIGLIFVLEMLSVIIQLSSKRWFKRKIFRSAPFHHHLQALGWPESKITMRLWIIGAFGGFLGVIVAMYG